MNMIRNTLIVLLVFVTLIGGCVPQENPTTPQKEEKQPPAEIPKGILVNKLPEGADIIFTSVRYVLSDIACLDENYDLKENFINDPECNRLIYAPNGRLASPRLRPRLGRLSLVFLSCCR